LSGLTVGPWDKDHTQASVGDQSPTVCLSLGKVIPVHAVHEQPGADVAVGLDWARHLLTDRP
jgi:hypothetical protein